MATKAEKEKLAVLLDEIETLRCWLDDTAYPRRSRASLEQALKDVHDTFKLEEIKG